MASFVAADHNKISGLVWLLVASLDDLGERREHRRASRRGADP